MFPLMMAELKAVQGWLEDNATELQAPKNKIKKIAGQAELWIMM